MKFETRRAVIEIVAAAVSVNLSNRVIAKKHDDYISSSVPSTILQKCFLMSLSFSS